MKGSLFFRWALGAVGLSLLAFAYRASIHAHRSSDPESEMTSAAAPSIVDRGSLASQSAEFSQAVGSSQAANHRRASTAEKAARLQQWAGAVTNSRVLLGKLTQLDVKKETITPEEAEKWRKSYGELIAQ